MDIKRFVLAASALILILSACSFQSGDIAADFTILSQEQAVEEINIDGESNTELTNLAHSTAKPSNSAVLALCNGDMVIQLEMSREAVEKLIGTDSIEASNGFEHYHDAAISIYYINETVAAMKPMTKNWSLPSGISLGAPKEDVLAAYDFTSIGNNGVNQLYCIIKDGDITTIDWGTFIDTEDKESKYFMSINANESAYDITIRDRRFMESFIGTGA